MITARVNAKKTLGQIDRVVSGLDAAVDRGLSQTAFKGQSVAKAKSKGSVAASIGVTQTREGYELQARAAHAWWVEHGRGPIVARPGSALRFVVSGRVVFCRSVKAARPRPFMAPAHKVMSRSRFVERSFAQLARGLK